MCAFSPQIPYYLCMLPRLRSDCRYVLYRETSSIKVNDIASQIADHVGAAVEAINSLPAGDRALTFHYNRCNPKRRRIMEPKSVDPVAASTSELSSTSLSAKIFVAQGIIAEEERKVQLGQHIKVSSDFDEGPVSLSKMVAVLCEQHLFLPLLRAFEMFLPSCSLLPFIRALQVCEEA
jgi:spatacsin